MPTTIRACTWNIELGRRLDRVLEATGRLPDFRALDVLLLQEASEHGPRADAEAIARSLGPTYRWHQQAVHVLRGAVQANALVWDERRVALGGVRAIELPRAPASGAPGLPAPGSGRAWRLERALLGRLPAQARGALVADGACEGLPLRICCAHLDVAGYRHRERQLEAVLEAAAAEPRPALTLLAGDLNTFGLRGFPSWGRLRRAACGRGFTDLTEQVPWTTHRHPTLRIRQKLDAIFLASRRPLRHRAWTADLYASDHLPLWAEVTVE
jgi:endonuclease/exonuclease/phosphatase family metal-dependent hydrolase